VPVFQVTTANAAYPVIVERGAIARVREHLPPKHGKVFVISEESIWAMHGAVFDGIADHTLFLPGGEENKRLSALEAAAECMVDYGADRTSVVIAFGGGIVNDMGGFLAAIFMRGLPVIQIPTTLLAQVDAAVGGKTGVNLERGKNLIGSFHQPLAVLIDPSVLATLPDREYRAGLFEVIKCGVIASPELFLVMRDQRDALLARDPEVLDRIIAESVQIKAEVVSADERESGLRKILNFGHTVGHAIEAVTGYTQFLHGEAVALGMRGATELARLRGELSADVAAEIIRVIASYGPLPSTAGIAASDVYRRLRSDKKTMQGDIHFVLPLRIGATEVVSGLTENQMMAAVMEALA
jgi:3-dehydroquinate synthase